MDYVVGSVAALISGNVTPNRPRLMKRALTPTKHQASPNVTPKSELVDDKSIFLSPSVQRKKAVVKKSPKRIFENQNLDATNDGEDISSPKADKVKKHLKVDLEAVDMAKIDTMSPKSPKPGKAKNKSAESVSPKKKINGVEAIVTENIQVSNEITPKKKKKQRTSVSSGFEVSEIDEADLPAEKTGVLTTAENKSSKKKRKLVSESETAQIETQVVVQAENSVANENQQKNPKKKRRKNKKPQTQAANTSVNSESTEKDNVTPSDVATEKQQNPKKKNRKRKNKNAAKNNQIEKDDEKEEDNDNETDESAIDQGESLKKRNKKEVVNPNAITNEDSDSEHESDDDIESETEEANNEVLKTEPAEESSDEEEEEVKLKKKPVKKEQTDKEKEEEARKTLFVGNVPYSVKCKKEIKKIFHKYGPIETIRIRTVPVKDARVTPKLAVIKNELHPERTTVNVYIKFADEVSVAEALAENNTLLNDHHLRVTRSDTSGVEHDPHCSVFLGNLPFALEDEALRNVFEKCGEIESVRIVRDKKTNAGKGFGFVNFKSKDGVELALALTEEDLSIKNRIIRVSRCQQNPQKQRPERNQGNQRGQFQGRDQNFRGRDQNFRGRGRGGSFRGRGGSFRGRGGSFRGRGGNFQGQRQGGFGRQGQDEGKEDGAYRRVMNKRPNQEPSDGPPNKRANLDQPGKEKKARKEFVGMTAEKKKKQKFDKGQKKKKALSEILAK